MRINEALNLVVPVYGDEDHVVGYVHSIPLARATFEANYRLVAATFAAIFDEGLGELAGPRVAALILKEVAQGKRLDPQPLLNEIKRLSCFIRPGETGWEQVPLAQAEQGRLISEDDMADVMSAIVFFTVAWAMWPKVKRAMLMAGAARLWGAETSSSQPTEWIASLKTSTEIVSSSATAQSGVIPT